MLLQDSGLFYCLKFKEDLLFLYIPKEVIDTIFVF